MSTVVLACADREPRPILGGIDGVIYVRGLCRRPGDLTGVIAGSDRVVMIVHSDELVLGKVQRSVRSAGIDPLGVQFLSDESIGSDVGRATKLVAGALARADGFGSSVPEHARPSFGRPRTRRALLTVPLPQYEAIPLIDEAACAASDGCRACVDECPQAAYRWSLGQVHFDREACVTCGRCLTVCPVGAIGNPTLTGRGLTAQIDELVSDTGAGPYGVAFVCRRRTRYLATPGWGEVEVPCTGMIPATWPIAALLAGAPAVAVVPCSAAGCGLGNDGRAIGAVALAQDLIADAGLDPSTVVVDPETLASPFDMIHHASDREGASPLDDPFGVHGPAEVVLALQELGHAEAPVAGWGPAAYRGVVAIDTAVCTLCLACTQTCPTGALGSHTTADRLAVTFDAATCTGCSQCALSCPELESGAIGVDVRIDTVALRAGRLELATSATTSCELCGAPIAPAAMLDRISQLLGEEHNATMAYLERRCMDCRGAR